MSKLVAIATIVSLSTAVKQYVATFDPARYGIDGTVTVDNGKVMVDIDLSGDVNFTDLADNFTYCTSAGLSYHIHYWKLDDELDRTGSGCGPDNTGGHWDPWQGINYILYIYHSSKMYMFVLMLMFIYSMRWRFRLKKIIQICILYFIFIYIRYIEQSMLIYVTFRKWILWF